jgi:hypothetical protein
MIQKIGGILIFVAAKFCWENSTQWMLEISTPANCKGLNPL